MTHFLINSLAKCGFGKTPPDPADPDQPTDPDQPAKPDQPEEPVSVYEIGEWKDWYRAAPLPKWKVRNGELLTNVSANFPELLAYLKLPENTWMLRDEPEGQELSRAAGGIKGRALAERLRALGMVMVQTIRRGMAAGGRAVGHGRAASLPHPAH